MVNDYLLKVYDPDIYAQKSHYDLMVPSFHNHFEGTWLAPDADGRWLSGKKGVINLPPMLQEHYQLRLSLTPLVPYGRQGRVKVYFNGHQMGEWRMSPRRHEIHLDIPADMIRKENKIAIKTNFSNIAREVIPRSRDVRSLSVQVHEMIVQCAAHSEVSAPHEPTYLKSRADYMFRVFAGEDDEINFFPGEKNGSELILTLKNDSHHRQKNIALTQPEIVYEIPQEFYDRPLQVSMTMKEPSAGVLPLRMHYINRPRERQSHFDPGYFAYYYPWYEEGHRDYFVNTPLYEDYDFSEEQVKWEIEEAMQYGVDGFCMEYYGTGGKERYDLLMEKASEKDFPVIFFVDGLTIYHRVAPELFYEKTNRFAQPLPPYYEFLYPYIQETIDIIHYFDHPSYFFIDNRPAVYIYAVGTNWDISGDNEFLKRLLRFLYGINAFYIGDFGATAEEDVERFAPSFDALTYYTPIDTDKMTFDPSYSTEDMKKLNRELHQKLAPHVQKEGRFYPVLCNGYDDHLINPDWHHPGISTELFEHTFRHAQEHSPELIFIATWNELMEGNSILPTQENERTFLELLYDLQKEVDHAP